MSGTLLAIEETSLIGVWRGADARASDQNFRRCANRRPPFSCNWLLDSTDDAHVALCKACRLDRHLPDLSAERNRMLLARVQQAKRRVVSQLLALKLPVMSKTTEDKEHGLAFDFPIAEPGEPPVITGHADGIITINLGEADDSVRETTRARMNEAYRTMVGHFRHELGHYYWAQLIEGSVWADPFRHLFGDERADYSAALKKRYTYGPPTDWQEAFISAYASVHPWEDWAETWAHYLHIMDTVHTAKSFDIQIGRTEMTTRPFGNDDLWSIVDNGAQAFIELVNSWVSITTVMNEMSRAMGQPDFYPFVLPSAVVTKLHFIDCVIRSTAVTAARVNGMSVAA
jgi:hypothetical protein